MNKGRFDLGHVMSPEVRAKISDGLKRAYQQKLREPVKLEGENNPNWRGDGIGNHAVHNWIKKTLGKPDTCEKCNRTGLNRNQIHWANKSGKYKREISDWQRLCMSCHMKYDFANGFRKDKRSATTI